MRRALLAAHRVHFPVHLASAILLLAVALSTGVELGEPARRAQQAVAVTALGVFAACVVLALLGPRALRQQEATVVASPVRGRWLGVNSPASKIPSHGTRAYGQSHAIDLVAEPAAAARPSFGGGAPAMRPAAAYPAFGQPVFAMVDGVVVRAAGWRRDHRARSNWLGLIYLMVEGGIRQLGGPGFMLGNHVTIRDDNGAHALTAHLQKGSVTVHAGDRVRAGQQIGRCGNSGNSSEPHVHAGLMDRASPWTAQGLPIAFAGISVDESDLINGLPANGEHMVAGEQPGASRGPTDPKEAATAKNLRLP